MEAKDRANSAETAKNARDGGSNLDPKRLATFALPPHWEAKALSLPVYSNYRKKRQNPDGTIVWQAGVDGWESWGS